MAKVTLKRRIEERADVDVEFPIYRVLRLDRVDVYARIESEETMIEVWIYDEEKKTEIEIARPEWNSEIDYCLGRGQYASSKEEFDIAKKKAAEIFAKL